MSVWRRLSSKTFTAVLRMWVCLCIRSRKIHTVVHFYLQNFVLLSSKLYYKWKLQFLFFNKLNNKITEIVHELYGQPSYTNQFPWKCSFRVNFWRFGSWSIKCTACSESINCSKEMLILDLGHVNKQVSQNKIKSGSLRFSQFSVVDWFCLFI